VSPKTAGRPREQKLGALKIVQSALALCEKSGAKGLTLRALAGELGVDPMAIYHYFPDRTALLSAALSHGYRNLTPNFQPSKDAVADIQNLLERYVKLSLKYVELMIYLMGQRETSLPNLDDFNRLLLEAIARYADSPGESAFIRDVLIDYTHGYVIAAQHFSATELKKHQVNYEKAVRLILGVA